MEAERPIEKLLRTSAQKRAEDAGEPLSPHPAMRRMLQGEVARVYGQARSAAEPSHSATWSLSRLWPSLGWSLALLVGLCLAASLMLPQRKAQNFELAMAPKPASAASEAPATLTAQSSVRKETLSDEARTDRDTALSQPEPQRQPLLAYDAAGEKSKLDNLNSPAAKDGRLREQANAPMPAAVPAAPPVAANGAIAPLKTETAHDALAASKPAPTPSTLGLAGSAPAPSGEPKRAFAESEGKSQLAPSESAAARQGGAGTRYVQTPSVAGGLLDKSVPPVLATFQFEQTGSKVRIVDADGSVYNGWLGAAAANEQRAGGSNAPANSNRRFRSVIVAPAQARQEAANAFSFQAEGTNQTLKQKVLLTGELYLSPVVDLKKALPKTGDASDAAKQNEPAGATGVDASRISAKAVIGDAVFDVNAVSAP